MASEMCIACETELLEQIENELVLALQTSHQRTHPRSRTGSHIRAALVGLDQLISDNLDTIAELERLASEVGVRPNGCGDDCGC